MADPFPLMANRTVKISVVSDLVCPWSYITTKQILDASNVLQSYDSQFRFELEHKPYLLNPSWADDESHSMKDQFVKYFGAERWGQMQEVTNRRGAEVGVKIQRDNAIICSTFRAHRLLMLAWRKGGSEVQTKLLIALYQACLERCENICDLAVLSTKAQEVGLMSKEEAFNFLKSDELTADVHRIVSCVQRNGVNGVPFIVINGRWALSGGQSLEVFQEIFDKLAHGQEPAVEGKINPAATC